MQTATVFTQSGPWLGRLELDFAQRAQATRVFSRHIGPLRIQRAFYPESDGTCHVYVLHPPGGLVGGDELELDVKVAPACRALLTTPAATKLYRSNGKLATISQHLGVDSGASLEWLPQETIAFDGSDTRVETIASLEAGARFIGWEIACLGRPACGERFDSGRLTQRFEVWSQQQPLLCERLRIHRGDRLLNAAWGLRDCSVLGTLAIVGAETGLLEAARTSIRALNGSDRRLGATQMEGALVVRYVGNSASEARTIFVRLWECLRPSWGGQSSGGPRIWNY